MSQKLKGAGFAVGALIALALVFVVSIIAGVIGMGASGAILAAVLYFIGVVSFGTAKAIFLGFFAVGAVLGLLRGFLVLAGGAAGQ